MDTQLYTDQSAIENYLLIDVDATYLDQLDEWIEGVSREIMHITGRQFLADAEASERVFDGDSTPELLIDDCVEITKVERGNDTYGGSFTEVSEGGASGYVALPNNYAARGVPIRKLLYRGGEWGTGEQNQRITAKWGYAAEVPADIKFAATVIVAGILNATRKDQGEIQSERIGNYSVSYRDEKGWADLENVKQTLASYKRYRI